MKHLIEPENAIANIINDAEIVRDPPHGGTSAQDRKQADILIRLAQEADLFHVADRTGFADLDINGHRETWSIRSNYFKRWLQRRFYETTNGAAGTEALQSALSFMEAKADYASPERQVHTRVGGLNGCIYIDLCDEAWRVVEIDSHGWRVIDNPPVRFRRSNGMLPLPVPMAGGSIQTLRSFLNAKSDDDFVIVVSWILSAFRNVGPYPVMVLAGEQGSAKSTFSGMVRSLIDPNTAPLRALPREDRDLFIAATNGHVLAFDNVSGLSPWMSDTLCRLSTGGGFALRQLYTDQDEVLFNASRPMILNGIEDIVTRPDLADRSLFLTLEPIPDERRRTEAELWGAFEAERPRMLGVLFDAVVEGLRRLPETRLPTLPRMADFAMWATACEPVLWPPGTFWSAYRGNRDEAVDGVIDADPVATAVRILMTEQAEWVGTAAGLLTILTGRVAERVAKSKNWPDNPRALSGRIRRAGASLRKVGIEVSHTRDTGKNRNRLIHIDATSSRPPTEESGIRPSEPVATSVTASSPSLAYGLAGAAALTAVEAADSSL